MATILNATSRHILDWENIVRSSQEDGFCALPQMVSDGVHRFTGTIARMQSNVDQGTLAPFSERDTESIQKVLTVLNRYTSLLPEKGPNARVFLEEVEALGLVVDETDPKEVQIRAEELRLKAREVQPRSEGEIQALIQAKSLIYTIRQQHPIPKEKPVVAKKPEPAEVEVTAKPLFERNVEWVKEHRVTTAIAAVIVSSAMWYSPTIMGSIVLSAASFYAYQAMKA